MIAFDFDHADFHSCLKDFARELGTTLDQDTLTLPRQYGEGYLRIALTHPVERLREAIRRLSKFMD